MCEESAIGEGVCIPLCQRALFPLRIFRYILQSGRLDPGNSRPKCFLHMEEGCFIFVALSWPKEAPETIISMARHELNMHMGDSLTDTVVDGEKRSIGLLGHSFCPFPQIVHLKQCPGK